MHRVLALLATFLFTTEAFLGGGPAWNDLRVTFGNPLTSFNAVPRTVKDAVADDFKLISACGASKNIIGNRYMKDGDEAVILIFDKNGYIAGIEAGIPSLNSNPYPYQEIMKYFREESGGYKITAYFVNPATICSTGRTEAEFNQQGTGTGLYIQTGPNPASDYITIPLKESEVQGTKWTLGKCFYGMGVHYWYNLSEDMSCNDFAPIFLLYNKGKLNAFGWAFQGNYPSTRYEHPSQNTFGLFMKAVPKCLKTVGTISTLHIYLTRTPALNFC